MKCKPLKISLVYADIHYFLALWDLRLGSQISNMSLDSVVLQVCHAVGSDNCIILSLPGTFLFR